jgi:hypothetical protein
MVARDVGEAALPPGYRLRFEVRGEAAPGFAEDPEQRVLVYARGADDIRHPLTVAFSDRDDVALIGTHGRTGSAVSLGDANVDAVYHDGMWELDGSGTDQFVWNDRDVHSITARRRDRPGTIAVRAARSRDASYGRLLRIVQRLTA